MKTLIFLVLVGYVFYILLIRPLIISAKFGKDKSGISLPDEIDDSIKLMEYLRIKNFTYPEIKNMRHNELGQVVIEGKYTSHALIIQDRTLFVDRGQKGSSRKESNCIMEAVVIGHYLTKLFDPIAPIDAYKQYSSFKIRRLQPLIIMSSLLCLFLISAVFSVKNAVVPQFSSNNISESYLSEYSTEITVGNAFNKFFNEPKWKNYEEGIQKYVDFQGGLLVRDEPATAVITFSISGEKFKVESVKIDNEALSPIDVQSFLETVYSKSKEPATNPPEVSTNINDQKNDSPPADITLDNVDDHEIQSNDIFPSLSNNEKKALNIFFSNFSEVNFGSYNSENYNEEDLIDFGIMHNYINNNDRITNDDLNFMIKDTYVADTINRFFDINIEHHSTKQFEYNNGTYSWPAGAGEPYWNFSQVTALTNNSDGTLTASIEIYSSGPDYEGNKIIYEPQDSAWGDFTPEFIGNATAIVKKATVNGKETYHLLKYDAGQSISKKQIYEDPDNSLNEVSLTVYGDNKVTGDISINTIDDKSALIEFKGVLKNGVVNASFQDDGWGESGTFQLTVNENSAALEINVSESSNSTGWGVTSGDYKFTKID